MARYVVIIIMGNGLGLTRGNRREENARERPPGGRRFIEWLADAPRVSLAAGAFALGIALAWWWGGVSAWPWVTGAWVLLVCAAMLRRGHSRVCGCGMLLTIAALGGAWLTLRHHRVPEGHLASMIGEQPVAVRMRGVATSSPVVRDTASGSMAVFNFQPPASYFRMRVEALASRDGAVAPVSGDILVRCDETLPRFRPGDRVEVIGTFRRFPPASNPGEFDRATYARALDQAGMLRVGQRELVTIEPVERSAPSETVNFWRERLRARAGAWIRSDLPPDKRNQRDALLAALLLGEREPELVELNETFRRTGLAHVLAISGMHLGILAGLILMVLRMTGRSSRWHALVLIVLIVTYVGIIEARLPVLRAALMICVGSLGLLFGRRLRLPSLVALSGLILLAWKPSQLFDAGFQLSFGVVLGLVHLSPVLRRAWFGPRDQLAPTGGAMLLEWLKDSVAGGVVAWAVATPLVAHHFGMITPLAALGSIITLPVVAVLLGVGYLKMIFGAILPSAGLFLGAPLVIAADLLVSVVEVMDMLPLATVRVPFPGSAWTLLTMTLIAGWVLHRTRLQRRALWGATVMLAAWLWWPVLPVSGSPALRIDMLSVGDGSCYVVRSGGACAVFDAGSSTDLDAGRSTIIRAMERLGVSRVDFIAVSHANLDHFSAVIELVERFDMGEVLLTPQFLEAAARDPLSPAGYLCSVLNEHLVAISAVREGDGRSLGDSTWTWLHPRRDDVFSLVNDTSMVVRVEAAGRSVLLTGDIQRGAMIRLLDRFPSNRLDADVLELPHHGSHHDAAETFVRIVSPQVVMQSTGWTRFERDAWAAPLAPLERLVTVRDGAGAVIIDRAGTIRVERFRELSSPP
ncbi:MAG: ComEC/Rec2 family competence protein [Phycisphaeraceae bacterium]|nr:MAG: ComEC/Rec2 family competence protein [Phycisphaeraceae bacterium]